MRREQMLKEYAIGRRDFRGENLSDIDLSGTILSGVNLTTCNLRGANLQGADLSSSDLCYANLSGSDLTGANLDSATLSASDLSRATLVRVNMSGAALRGARLMRADLTDANLANADLSDASLIDANLLNANLSGTNLFRTFLSEIKNFPEAEVVQRTIVPPLGTEFTGWKKLRDGSVAELKIPADAERVGGVTSRKCRASRAIVVTGEGESLYKSGFYYKPGHEIKPESWDSNPLETCAGGIHFFLTREEAEEYTF